MSSSAEIFSLHRHPGHSTSATIARRMTGLTLACCRAELDLDRASREDARGIFVRKTGAIVLLSGDRYDAPHLTCNAANFRALPPLTFLLEPRERAREILP